MATGREVKAAFKKATTWGTAVACAESDLVLITSESVRRTRETLLDDSAGHPFTQTSDLGLITCSGTIGGYLRYRGLDTLLAMVMGAAGTPAEKGEGYYTHTMTMADDTEGLFGTLAVYKGFSVHEVPSAKVGGFTISGRAGQPMQVSFDIIGNNLNVNTTSGQNTVTTMEDMENAVPEGRVMFRDASFYINDKDDVALGLSSLVHPSAFSLSVKRSLESVHLAGGGDMIAEPLSNGFPTLSLSLEFPVYTSDVFFSSLGSGTSKKMVVNIQSGENILGMSMPHVVLTNVEACVNGAGKITNPVSATLLASSVAPTGMDTITKPLRISLVNKNSTDPLA